jgi:hypothetical protein
MKNEINEMYHGDIRKLCDDLTLNEKKELVIKIIYNDDIDVDDIYDSLSTWQKENLMKKLMHIKKTDQYDELFYNHENSLNMALINLLNKSRMLTKNEEQLIITISEQYKHF